jgi:carbon monoxide dehydrogenase subunit G
MAITTSADIDAPVEKVWRLVGNFSGIRHWHPAVDECTASGDGVGATRTVRIGAQTVVERLEILDQSEYLFGYVLERSDPPGPLVGLRGTIKLTTLVSGKTHLDWTASIAEGNETLEIYERMKSYYQSRLIHLEQALGLHKTARPLSPLTTVVAEETRHGP